MLDGRLVQIGEAARTLVTTPGQLRKWESPGELLPARKTGGGARYYAISDLLGRQAAVADPLTVCCARVSSHTTRKTTWTGNTPLWKRTAPVKVGELG